MTTINAAITQCPKCNTAFKITGAHLASAKGAVRCGSCLSIFNARDYIKQVLDPAPQPEKSVSLKETPQSVSLKASQGSLSNGENGKLTNRFNHDELIDDDELINDDPDDINDRLGLDLGDGLSDEFEMSYAGSEMDVENRSNLFERTPEKKESSDSKDDVDESWAEGLLDDDGDDEEVDALSNKDFADRNASRLINKEREAANNLFMSESGRSASQIADRDSGLNQRSFDPNPDSTRHSNFEKRLDKFQIVETEEDNQATQFENPKGPYEKPFLDQLDSEPVEFEIADKASIWDKRLITHPLVALLSLLLLLIVAWMNFPSLSKQEPYRKFYAGACEIVGCSLPELVNRKAIKATNLVVRSHPVDNTLLMVDTVLTNNAGFEQPFPELDLVFLTESNQVHAARRLKPRDYLAGELAGQEIMPERRPIRVGLVIKDPGDQAVSYAVSIPD